MREDLLKTGILGDKDQICAQDINEIHYGYPIYDLRYNRARSEITQYLTARDILPCGRYGSWRYFSMEDALLDGRRVAETFYKNA